MILSVLDPAPVHSSASVKTDRIGCADDSIDRAELCSAALFLVQPIPLSKDWCHRHSSIGSPNDRLAATVRGDGSIPQAPHLKVLPSFPVDSSPLFLSYSNAHSVDLYFSWDFALISTRLLAVCRVLAGVLLCRLSQSSCPSCPHSFLCAHFEMSFNIVFFIFMILTDRVPFRFEFRSWTIVSLCKVVPFSLFLRPVLLSLLQ